MSRRSSWVEVQTDNGDTYYYDDPDLGGTGTTQWEQPDVEQKDQQSFSARAPTAGSYDKLKKFMKAKSKHHEGARERARKKRSRLRSARIARLQQARSLTQGGITARFYRYTTDEGKPYYVSLTTKETTWELPPGSIIVDESDDETTDTAEYEKFTTDGGKAYYRNSITGEVTWEIPESYS